nr:MAG TPA: hypothetical protein [Ackermannviridae sp.]
MIYFNLVANKFRTTIKNFKKLIIIYKVYINKK